jgi:type IV secretory pathway VirB2 component (pilin)
MMLTRTSLSARLAYARSRAPDLARKALAGVTLGLGLVMAVPASASGTGMPWETPLQSIVDSVQGPVAKVIGVIIIVITGLTLAFGDTSGGFRKLIQIVFGLSVAFAASSFFLSFFSFGGGALV